MLNSGAYRVVIFLMARLYAGSRVDEAIDIASCLSGCWSTVAILPRYLSASGRVRGVDE